jgi:membrane-bound serine protease (ClpP class)
MGMRNGVLTSVVAVLLVLAVGPFVWGPIARGEEVPATMPAGQEKAVIIRLAGEINDYNRDELFRKFDYARRLGAKVVLLDVDTYGGLVTDGLEISRYIKRQTDLHVIAFVQDKAISAGAMISMACDEIVMSDSASLGDCAPVIYGAEGLEAMPAAERAKMEGPILTDFNESALRNHRDPLLAAAMVDVTRTVYWVENAKRERRFVDEKQYADLTATKQWWSVPGEASPIVGPTQLLTVDSDQAVRYGLASGKAESVEALAAARGYDIVADLSPGWGENLVEFLSGAIVRGILIVVFLQCLYVVLHAPGHGVAEVCGLVALGLMLGVPLLTGFAQWWEILIIFLGLLLVSFEILLPGHVFPGFTGGAMVLVGLVLTFAPVSTSGPSFDPSGMRLLRQGLLVVVAAMASSVFLWFWLSRFLPKLPVLNRLILTGTSGNLPVSGTSGAVLSAGGAASGAVSGPARWPLPGAIGKVITELRPGGSAEFFDAAIADRRIANVISESGFLTPGTEVVVREVSGPSVIVKKREGEAVG